MISSENAFGLFSLPYLVFTPEEASGGFQRDKVLVYLHGSGDRGKPFNEVKEGWGLLRLLDKQIRPLPFSGSSFAKRSNPSTFGRQATRAAADCAGRATISYWKKARVDGQSRNA
jgi:hypothetical protein